MDDLQEAPDALGRLAVEVVPFWLMIDDEASLGLVDCPEDLFVENPEWRHTYISESFRSMTPCSRESLWAM